MAEIQPFAGIQLPGRATSRACWPRPTTSSRPPTATSSTRRDPHNVVRIVLNRTPGDAGYAEAGETLPALAGRGRAAPGRDAGRSTCSSRASRGPGRTLRRFGLLARFRAEDKERRVILPHEHTRAAAKEDRWRVLLATKANFSPIFLMFPDPAAAFAALVVEAIGRRRGRAVHRRRRGRPPDVAGGRGGPGRPLPVAPRRGEGRTSRTATTATRPRCATATRSAPKGPGRSATSRRSRRRASWSSPTTGSSRRGRRSRTRRGDSASGFRLERRPDVAAAAARGGGLDRALRLRPGRARARARSWSRREPGSGAPARAPRPPACLRALDTYFLHHAVLGPLLGVPDGAVSYVHSQAEAEQALSRPRLPPRRADAGDAGPADRGRGRGGGVDAGQEHLLPPEAALGPRDPPPRRLSRDADEPSPAAVLRPRRGGPRLSRALPGARRRRRGSGRRRTRSARRWRTRRAYGAAPDRRAEHVLPAGVRAVRGRPLGPRRRRRLRADRVVPLPQPRRRHAGRRHPRHAHRRADLPPALLGRPRRRAPRPAHGDHARPTSRAGAGA